MKQADQQRYDAAVRLRDSDRALLAARQVMSVRAIAQREGVSNVAVYHRLKAATRREQIRQEAGI